MSSFREISPEEFGTFEKVLIERLPKSTRIYNILKINALQCLPAKLHTKFFVHGGVLSQMSFIISMQYFENLEGGYYIIISCPTEHCFTPSILEGFEHFLDWTETLHFDFEENPVFIQFLRQMAQINRGMANTLPLLKIHESYAFAANRNEPILLPPESEPKGIREGSLEVKQLESERDICEVNTNWDRESKAIEVVSVSVSSLPSTGIYHQGTLASWTLTSFHGCVNALFTHDRYRGQGFGQWVTRVIAKGQVNLGLIPCARSLRANTTAHRTLEGAGLVKGHNGIWVDYIGRPE